MNKDYRTGVTQFLLDHAASNPVSFHMPGHKGSDFYRRNGYGLFLERLMDCDITEIQGADNLFVCADCLGESADKYKKIYDVCKTYLQINGTSGGIIASILATVPAGGKLLMSRNCHKSVYNALKLGGISPAYVYPTLVDSYGISGPVSPEDVAAGFDANPDAAAFILPSPNYYGICSDIKAIAEVCHERGKVLIVDQAHGAHLKLMEHYAKDGAINLNLPMSAETAGADLIINSTHKTLASFTQSAVLNVNSDRVDLIELEDKLQMIESSSPSYILMGSLDVNANIILDKGEAVFTDWANNVAYFYSEAANISGLKTMDVPGYLDCTKINLDMSAYGLDGAALEKLLIDEGIFVELTTGNLLMCMTGIGNTREDFDKLLNSLKRIASTHQLVESEPGEADVLETVWNKKRHVHQIGGGWSLETLDECEGKVCAGSIIPYPPGIPLICPGETVDLDDIEYLNQLISKGRDVIGVDANKKIRINKK
ncbi:MAG: hypothetical protein KBS66_02470 [Eubacterium sp.]|nr:hypothetical protein [Candidatus Colimonas fimequi]